MRMVIGGGDHLLGGRRAGLTVSMGATLRGLRAAEALSRSVSILGTFWLMYTAYSTFAARLVKIEGAERA